MNEEIKGAAVGFWDWLEAWWNLPLLPRLTSGQVIVIAAGILALWLTTILLNRLLRRLTPPSEGQNPHDSWLSLAVWVIRKPLLFLLWTAGIGGLIISQLGPWLHVWEGRPLFAHPLFSLLVIVTLGSVLGRALRAATRKLRATSLAAPTHWRSALALLTVLALQLLLPLLTFELILPLLPIPVRFLSAVRQFTGVFVIGAVGFLVAQLLIEFERVTLARRTSDDPFDTDARRAVTQVSVLRKIGIVLVALITIACMLMVFDPVRHFGQSILASAGLIGIIAGVAAQKSLANLFAGLQIAVTQPISLGDSVSVENEFGTVEDITLTYVVVRLWDLRRMVLPIGYFLEKPFINWTRRADGLLGVVTLSVKYSAPIAEVRAELDRLLAEDSRWDRTTKNLEVAGETGTGMQLRIVVSARSPGDLGGLRASIRELLIDFLRRKHPDSLP
jgi:small-conductance mechanosensitive channel